MRCGVRLLLAAHTGKLRAPATRSLVGDAAAGGYSGVARNAGACSDKAVDGKAVSDGAGVGGAPSPLADAPPHASEAAETGLSAASSWRARYSKSGYDFVEQIRVLGPRAAADRTQAGLLVYLVPTAALVAFAVYYFTTHTVVLTTDPSPQRSTAMSHFPCDCLVLVNRWTGGRRTVRVDAAAGAQRRPDGTSPYQTRRVHVNRLKDRALLYQQKSTTSVVVDLHGVLRPDQFAERGRAPAHAGAATTRGLPAYTDGRANSRGGQQPQKASTPQHGRLLVQVSMRMRDTFNGAAQGRLVVFRETIVRAVTEELVARYRSRLLEDVMRSGMKRGYAEELIRNGAATAEGVAFEDIVPDMNAFEDQIWTRVTERIGDDVIVYDHSLQRV